MPVNGYLGPMTSIGIRGLSRLMAPPSEGTGFAVGNLRSEKIKRSPSKECDVGVRNEPEDVTDDPACLYLLEKAFKGGSVCQDPLAIFGPCHMLFLERSQFVQRVFADVADEFVGIHETPPDRGPPAD